MRLRAARATSQARISTTRHPSPLVGEGPGERGCPGGAPPSIAHTETHHPMPIRLRRSIPALLAITASLTVAVPARSQALTPVERRIAVSERTTTPSPRILRASAVRAA